METRHVIAPNKIFERYKGAGANELPIGAILRFIIDANAGLILSRHAIATKKLKCHIFWAEGPKKYS